MRLAGYVLPMESTGERTGPDASHGHPLDPDRVRTARERLPTREDAAQLTTILSLMADPTRARLLHALDVVPEMCVGDLALALDVNEDAASYGLRVLRTAGLVTYRREGRALYYRLAEGFPEPLREHCLRHLIELARRTPPDDEE